MSIAIEKKHGDVPRGVAGSPDAWVARAADLARFATERLVNRPDRWGAYEEWTNAAGRTQKVRTAPWPKERDAGRVLQHADLERHFTGRAIIGLHSTSPSNTSQWVAWDFDQHDPGLALASSCAQANLGAALKLVGHLQALGLHPILEDSNGRGGYHAWLLFEIPIETAQAFAFAQHMLRELDLSAETYPKQAGIGGGVGNWLRLPGRHHTHDHWSRFWDGKGWLDGAEAVDYLLRAPLSSPALIPTEQPIASPEPVSRQEHTASPALSAGALIGVVSPDLGQRIAAYAAELPIALGEGEGRNDAGYTFACFLTRDLALADDLALPYLAEWNAKHRTPMAESKLTALVAEARRYGQRSIGSGLGESATAHQSGAHPIRRRERPKPSPAVFHGLAGDFVRLIEPHTEADPMALLVQFMAALGNALGRTAHQQIDGAHHFYNEFALIVGPTASGRKGTALEHVKTVMRAVDEPWARNCVATGLSTTEGLIEAVKDPVVQSKALRRNGQIIGYEEEIIDHGVADKRLLVVATEFASPLRAMRREGNTLSPTIRAAWDDGDLRCLTKSSPVRATGAHITIIGHITQEELHQELTKTDVANGFGNRFLIVYAERSKYLPDGGAVDGAAVAALADQVREALNFGQQLQRMHREPAAKPRWDVEYRRLTRGRSGLAGKLTTRAAPHVMRLAGLYAVLDRSPDIRLVHLDAALALWAYCEASVRYIFGDGVGHADADLLAEMLRMAPQGLTRTDLSEAVGRNWPAPRLKAAIQHLVDADLVRSEERRTNGRPCQVFSWNSSDASVISGREDVKERQEHEKNEESHTVTDHHYATALTSNELYEVPPTTGPDAGATGAAGNPSDPFRLTTMPGGAQVLAAPFPVPSAVSAATYEEWEERVSIHICEAGLSEAAARLAAGPPPSMGSEGVTAA